MHRRTFLKAGTAALGGARVRLAGDATSPGATRQFVPGATG